MEAKKQVTPLADVLFGNVTPSGKLNYSFPQSTGHLPAYYNHLPSDKGYYKRPGSYDQPGSSAAHKTLILNRIAIFQSWHFHNSENG